jgi:galactokinase
MPAAVNRANPTRIAASLFADSYARQPGIAASAPGRVNLIGEHTDYNGGPVLPLALQRRTTVVAAPASRWEFVSDTDPTVEPRDIDEPMRHRWSDYLVGVVRELRQLGIDAGPAQMAVATTVPIGAGLSSSAALTVAATKSLSLLAGRRLTPAQVAEVAFRAEYHQVGVRCGRMDQTIAAHARSGCALLFDTASRALTHVAFPTRLWIVETGVSHQLTGGHLNERRRECEEASELLRARWPGLEHLAALPPAHLPQALKLLDATHGRRVRHVVTETARTRSAAAALASGNLSGLGDLLFAGHASLKNDYGSTIPEADFLVEAAARHGAYGARLSGAGWGGAVLVLGPTREDVRMVESMARDFREAFGRVPLSWSTRASAGVRSERV